MRVKISSYLIVPMEVPLITYLVRVLEKSTQPQIEGF